MRARSSTARRRVPLLLVALCGSAIAAHVPANAGELEGLFKRAAQRIKDEAARKAEDRVVDAARQPLRAAERQAQPDGTRAGTAAATNRSYDAPRADVRIGGAPQSLWLAPRMGGKFAAMEGAPAQVVAVNPYLDPQRPFFGTLHHLQCAADGSVVVSGDAGLDAQGGTAGRGWWKIAADGAITPLATRRLDAPGEVRSGFPFALARDGTLLAANEDALLRIDANGNARAIASGLSRVGQPVLDPAGNAWFANDDGCELRRLAPDGSTTTVIPRERGACGTLPVAERVNLQTLAWDPVHGELVAGGGRIVDKPLDMHVTLWRIRPDGQARRVYYTVKAGRSPIGQNTDTIWSLTVDAQGHIVVATRLMDDQARRQVMRLDEARGRLVPLTGQSYRKSFGGDDYRPGHEEAPYDGPAASANFREAKDLCYGPDGTLFVLDEHQLRRLDTDGRVRTWAY